jgi:hypothetical protein
MAVAAHVSRVAKDYAPHGYSVMGDFQAGTGTLAGSAGLALRLPLRADEADIRIESITITTTPSNGGPQSDTKNWKISFAAWNPDTAGPVSAGARNTASTTLLATVRETNVAGGPFTAWAEETMTLVNAPIVPKGSVFAIFVDPLPASGPTVHPDALSLMVWVRYRRKA